MAHAGLLISIEGKDSRKVFSHIRLLEERMKAANIAVSYIPSKDTDRLSTYYINQYKRGGFGKKQDLGPYLPALFHGMDRFAIIKKIGHKLEKGEVVIIDRSIISDMYSSAHILANEAERLSFYTWLDMFSHQVLQHTTPDITIFLDDTEHPDTQYQEIIQLFPTYIMHTLDHSNTITRNVDLIWKAIEGELANIPRISQRTITKTAIEPLVSQHTQKSIEKKIKKYSTGDTSSFIPEARIITNISLLMESYATHSTVLPLQDLTSLLQRDINGNFKYYTPPQLDLDTAKQYEAKMDIIYENIQTTTEKLIESQQKLPHILFHMLPLAARRNYYTHDITSFTHIPLDEAAILMQTKLQAPKIPKEVQHIISSLDSGTYSSTENTNRIVRYSPRNETDIITQSIFSFTGDSMADTSIDILPYTDKATLIKHALKSIENQNQYQYTFELLLPLGTMLHIKENVNCTIQTQHISPRHGYSYTDSLDTLGIGELYEASFDTSYELFDLLQSAGFETIAPYATLLGHKQRYLITIDGSSLMQLLAIRSSALQEFQKELIQLLTSIHPHFIEYSMN